MPSSSAWKVLLIAARSGHHETVAALMEEKADPEMGKPNGTGPLYIAAQNGHVHVVKILVDGGAMLLA